MIESLDRNYDSGDERITRRTIDGVNILEKETHRVIKLAGGRYVNADTKREPRLVVVDDAGADLAPIITKDRSSIAGLDAFIRSIFNTPAVSK